MTTQVKGPLISDGAIATAKIADGAVTAAKLAAGALGTASLADGGVAIAKLATAIKPELLIGVFPVSAAAVLDITGFNSGLYTSYRIELERVFPATSQILWLRTSTNNGASFDAGATDYAFSSVWATATSGVNAGSSNGSDRVQLTAGHAVAASGDQGLNAEIRVLNPGATQRSCLTWQGGAHNGTDFFAVSGTGWRLASADVDAVRIMAASGNISGTARLYGTRI